MQQPTRIHLRPGFFDARERTLVEHGELSVSAFQYDSGVAALRLRNSRGDLILLPFQGQQIWRAQFGGRELTMQSMFDEPRNTREYLQNYGGLLVHCGISAMGVPGPGDTHVLHGELPNAPYQQAWIETGTDDAGDYIALGGAYQHTVAFTTNYVAEPSVKLRAGQSLFDIDLKVTNLRKSPMDLMYLAHLNLRPVENGRLVYTARVSPETTRVRKSIPSHVKASEELLRTLDEVQKDPARHHILTSALCCDPELVLTIDYLADRDGWAHSLQVHPDGSADYVAHRPSELRKGVRWICRTPDQQALGLVLPATAEPEGYTAEKAKGNILSLAAGGTFHCAMRTGALDATSATAMAKKIADVVG